MKLVRENWAMSEQPAWECPRCDDGRISVDPKTIQRETTRDSPSCGRPVANEVEPSQSVTVARVFAGL